MTSSVKLHQNTPTCLTVIHRLDYTYTFGALPTFCVPGLSFCGSNKGLTLQGLTCSTSISAPKAYEVILLNFSTRNRVPEHDISLSQPKKHKT